MSATSSQPLPPPDALNELLETSWDAREQRVPRRELVFEAALTCALLAGSIALLATGPAVGALAPIVAVLVSYGIASRVAYPLGAGNIVPTQPFLVVMFAVAPPAGVPLLVCVALAGATLADAALGRTHVERTAFAGGNAIHALGPALVLTLGAHGSLLDAPLLVLLFALAAQVVLDFVASTIREWVAAGVKPQMQARIIAQVTAVDVTLAPLGFVAAVALDGSVWAPLVLLPLVALLSYTADERSRGVQRARERLVALERERARLRVAIGRVGEAFASKLDLEALLATVTRVSAEALDAAGGRAVALRDTRPVVIAADVDEVGAEWSDVAITAAERLSLSEKRAASASGDGWHALACRIAHEDEALGTIAVCRRTAAFDDEDSSLLQYLCDQAAVAAGGALHMERLHEQATVDDLTGLANHRRFQELLGQAVDEYHRSGRESSLILLDLDHFKRLNDEHGHQFGDTVLRRVGTCLNELTRQGDEPSRYGGEELAIVVGAGVPGARELAERIRHAVSAQTFVAPNREHVQVTLSAGVAPLNQAHPTRETVFRAADAALYAAKRRGRDCVVVADGTAPEATEAGAGPRATTLSTALTNDQLRLDFQPIVHIGGGRTVAVEALVRWQHPERGLIGPNDFIPVAEREGLMPALGSWVLSDACRHAARLLDAWPGLALTVNVSPTQLMQSDFAEDVQRILESTGLPAEALILELTETVLLRDVPEGVRHLAAVRERGVRVAIDDFGTGHAGLEHLMTLPVDIVKIPQTYIGRLDGPSARDRLLCESLVELVRRMGFGLIAEGVERPEQRDALVALGVEHAQGFLFSRPLAAPALREWLASARVSDEDELALRRAARREAAPRLTAVSRQPRH